MTVTKEEAADRAKAYIASLLENHLSPDKVIDGSPDATFCWTKEGPIDDYWFMPMPDMNDGKVCQLSGDIVWMSICKKTGEVSTIQCG